MAVITFKNLPFLCYDWKINGSQECRVHGNLNISFKDVSGEEIQTLLNERNIAISIGSACHSGQNKISETPDLGIMRNVGSLPLLSRYPNSSLGSVGRGRLVF